MKRTFSHLLDSLDRKRWAGKPLDPEEHGALLADCIRDKAFFSSPRWNWRYGGVRFQHASLEGADPGRILVLLWPGALGDVAMSAPALSVLRRTCPGAEITFLTSRAGRLLFLGNQDVDALLENPLDPYLDRVMNGRPIDMDRLHRDVLDFSAALKGRGFDWCINFQILPMSAALARVSFARRHIGMTLSDDGMPVIRGNKWAVYLFGVSANLFRTYNALHRAEIFQAMISGQPGERPGTGLQIHQGAVRSVERFFEQNAIEDRDLVIGLNPMSGTPIRRWPGFPRLARMLAADLKARVLVFGSRGEEEQVKRIILEAGGGPIPATRFDLQELMAALCGCDLVISNDTGPMHLACLLQRPVIALFGPTSPEEVGPWGRDYRFFQSARCRNCYNQTCRNPDAFCMDRIDPDSVLAAAREVLLGTPAVRPAKTLMYGGPSGNLRAADYRCGIQSLLFQGIQEPPSAGTGEGREDIPLTRDRKEALSDALGRLESLLSEFIASPLGNFRGQEGTGLHPFRDVFRTEEPLKLAVVFNDMLYLDKRLPLRRSISAHLAFSRALLNDLKTLRPLLGPPAVPGAIVPRGTSFRPFGCPGDFAAGGAAIQRPPKGACAAPTVTCQDKTSR